MIRRAAKCGAGASKAVVRASATETLARLASTRRSSVQCSAKAAPIIEPGGQRSTAKQSANKGKSIPRSKAASKIAGPGDARPASTKRRAAAPAIEPKIKPCSVASASAGRAWPKIPRISLIGYSRSPSKVSIDSRATMKTLSFDAVSRLTNSKPKCFLVDKNILVGGAHPLVR